MPPSLPNHPLRTRPKEPLAAISIKQPWAALIVAGLKTIEIRTWPTRRRGPVLIHAGKIADDRPEGWKRIDTPELKAAAELRGGIVGIAELASCKGYSTPRGFAADALLHLNETAWFAPPRMYGFVLRKIRRVEFHPCPGQTLFFPVRDWEPTA